MTETSLRKKRIRLRQVEVPIQIVGRRGNTLIAVKQLCNDLEQQLNSVSVDISDSRDVDLAELPASGILILMDGANGFPHPDDLGSIQPDLHVIVYAESHDRFIPDDRLHFANNKQNLNTSVLNALLQLSLSDRVFLTTEPNYEQLRQYFQLRYHNWEGTYREIDERPELTECESRLEIKESDLYALPILAVDRRTKDIVGCARIVYSRGRTTRFTPHVNNIASESTVLASHLEQFGFDHPFDMLEPFLGFDTYLSALTLSRKKFAELSRVQVSEVWRGRGIGSLLVNKAVRLARDQGISELFLACEPNKSGLYLKNGFRSIPDMQSTRFGTLKLAAIAMHTDIAIQV